jgi:hypothetical protein
MFWLSNVQKNFLTIFLECPEKIFDPLNGTLTKIFLATGGGEVDEKILQGVIDFRRAILADTPPQLKGASFAPGCRSHGGAGRGDQTVWGSSMLHPPL